MPVKKEDLKPVIKGVVKFEEPMSRHTSFRIGGPAEVFVYPSDTDDLLAVLRYAAEHKMGVFVIGGGSKLLVGDKGLRGFVVSLNAPAFNGLSFDGEYASAGCGMRVSEFLKKAAAEGLGGLEFLAGIPGTLGGAITMNAGWPTRSIGDRVEEVTLIKGLEKSTIGKSGLKFKYRGSDFGDAVLIWAKFKLDRKPKAGIEAEINRNFEKKRQTQDLSRPSVGSIFLNPSGTAPAWQVIEKSGLRGAKSGDAVLSEKHANFIVNNGKASAADVRALIDEIQKKVFKDQQIMLKLEVKIIGDF
ncbi:MAG TPA: UDP-N-acetylmuramate dehydrogenase [Candidatus Omnitrophota bacterium]|nr:UDP-N-acetylmuramate dehydrogenase [Candidatus Omnitrophota bacterium]HPN65966.1 UDP-N-acetylmuramate dehydrogenase [Candidatus Omnitrophota bacterium]